MILFWKLKILIVFIAINLLIFYSSDSSAIASLQQKKTGNYFGI